MVVLHNCKEHLDAMLALLLAYRAAMHVGGLARGWKGVEMWQNPSDDPRIPYHPPCTYQYH